MCAKTLHKEDNSTLVSRVFYDNDDDYWAVIYEVEDNPPYGMCVYFKTITTRVSSARSDSIPLGEFRQYVEGGEIEWVGYGKPGIQFAKTEYEDSLYIGINNLYI